MFNIRKANRNDFDVVKDFNKDLFLYEKIFSNEYDESWPNSNWGKEYFAKRLVNDNAIVLIGESDGKPVGYLLGFVDSYSVRLKNPLAEIENMYVKEEFRAKGLGSLLVSEFKKIAKVKGAKRMKVMSYSSNVKTIEFYKRHGFSDFAVILESDL